MAGGRLRKQILAILALNAVVWGIYIAALSSSLSPQGKTAFVQGGVILSLASAFGGVVIMMRRKR